MRKREICVIKIKVEDCWKIFCTWCLICYFVNKKKPYFIHSIVPLSIFKHSLLTVIRAQKFNPSFLHTLLRISSAEMKCDSFKYVFLNRPTITHTNTATLTHSISISSPFIILIFSHRIKYSFSFRSPRSLSHPLPFHMLIARHLNYMYTSLAAHLITSSSPPLHRGVYNFQFCIIKYVSNYYSYH